MKRVVADQGQNMYGNKLNHLALEANFNILNGTWYDRSRGGLTCFTQPNHPTTIDLTLASPGTLEIVHQMEVANYHLDLSDHCPISLITKIETSQGSPTETAKSWARSAEIAKAHWSKEEERDVANNIGSSTSKKDCAELLHQLATKKEGHDLDETVRLLNGVIFLSMAGNCRVTFHKSPSRKIDRRQT